MKLLLRCDIPNVGLAGDVVEVREGYARNYLIPQQMGLEPTKANMKSIEEDKRRAEEQRRLRRIALEQQAEKMRDVEVTISAACNLEGRLYGSVGPREIAAALRDEGHDVEPKQVHLPDAIRQLDTVTVPVIFADDLTIEVKVWIVRETSADDLEEEAEHQTDKQEASQDRYRYSPGSDVDALETDL